MNLKVGQIVSYHVDSGCLSVTTDGTPERWVGGDDKQLVPSLRGEFDLTIIVSLLASSQGLYCKRIEKYKYELVNKI